MISSWERVIAELLYLAIALPQKLTPKLTPKTNPKTNPKTMTNKITIADSIHLLWGMPKSPYEYRLFLDKFILGHKNLE